VLTTMDRRAEARGAFERALALVPNSARIPVRFAEALHAWGEIEEAEARLRAAVDRRPASLPAHLALAALLDETRRPEEAKDQLRLALDLAPDDPAALAALKSHQARLTAKHARMGVGASPEPTQPLPAAAELDATPDSLGLFGVGSPLSAPLPRSPAAMRTTPPPALHGDAPPDAAVAHAARTPPPSAVGAASSPATPPGPASLPGSPPPAAPVPPAEAGHIKPLAPSRRGWLARLFGRR
jgi:tetratricopeptide (TPR) repeat protein